MFYLRLFKTNYSKYMHTIVYALIGAIVPLLIIGTIVFSAIKIQNTDKSLIKGKVAVVTEDIKDQYTDMALNYLESMASTSSSMEFVIMDKDEAYSALDDNTIIAVIYLPAGVVNGILYGENIPVEISFNDTSSLQAVLLTELTKAGANLLSGAQSGTYAISELYYSLSLSDELNNAFNDVDMINFNLVLPRESTFQTINLTTNSEVTNKTNDSSFEDKIRSRRGEKEESSISEELLYFICYYLASGIVIFELLLSTSFTSYFQKETKGFYSILSLKKYALVLNEIIIFIIYFINLLILNTLLLILFSNIKIFNSSFNLNNFILTAIISLTISSFSYLMNRISNISFVTIIATFIASIILPFISGAIIPIAFIPEAIMDISKKLPFYYIHQNLISILNNSQSKNITILLLYSGLFLILGLIIDSIRRRRFL